MYLDLGGSVPVTVPGGASAYPQDNDLRCATDAPWPRGRHQMWHDQVRKGFAPRCAFLAALTHMAAATFPPSPARLRRPPVSRTCGTTTCGSANTSSGSPRPFLSHPLRNLQEFGKRTQRPRHSFLRPASPGSSGGNWGVGRRLRRKTQKRRSPEDACDRTAWDYISHKVLRSSHKSKGHCTS
jgi:hypothetical protein